MCLWWWGRLPSPTWTGRAVGRLPTCAGGLFSDFLMNQAKEIALDPSFLPQTAAGQAKKKCFCNEVYWKNTILDYALETAFTCSTNMSHYLQEIHIHMTETSSLAECFKYKKQKYWTVDWHELSSYAFFRKVSKLLSITDEKKKKTILNSHFHSLE